MGANESLSKIPVVVYQPARQRNLKWGRLLSQVGVILALILVPLLGVFRIDLSSGFVILGHQVWFSDFLLVFGFWLAAACTLILMYSTVGTAFCGWACPQNTFSTLANRWTMDAFGKRAVIDWESAQGSQINSRKNTIGNWIALGSKLVLASMLLAIIPLLYFQEPASIWSFITFQADERVAGSLHWIYFVFVVIVFVNLAVVRHFACRYMCIYRMWQFLFKTKDTLHIEYDRSRAADCAKCNYCITACMVDIDPRNTTTFDSCTNCGACIVACDTMHQKKNENGLLRFKLGPRANAADHGGTRSMGSLLSRARWVLPVWLLGTGLFVWGIVTYDSYHLAVYRAHSDNNGKINEYQINVASKDYSPKAVDVTVEGLPEEKFEVTPQRVTFVTADRKNATLKISDSLPPGLYPLTIRSRSEDGWTDVVHIQHVVPKG